VLYRPREPQPQQRPTIDWERIRRNWLRPFTWTLFLVLAINTVFPRYVVEGHSMEPNLHETARLFTINIDLVPSVQRGALVIARSPVGEVNVVKRLIGLPGESVEMVRGVVYVNGVRLDEPYVREASSTSGRWTLGADEYFVLGDNRAHSTDSGDYGPLPRERIEGLALFSYWPLNELSIFTPPGY
jgi:signal peptidase I